MIFCGNGEYFFDMIFCGNGEYFAFMLIDYKNCLL